MTTDDVRPGVRPAPTRKSAPTTPFPPLREGNDGAISGTTQTRRRVVRDLGKLAAQLSERDMAILRSVEAHRYLSVAHVQALHFGELPVASGRRTVQRVLARLRRLQLLGRIQQRIGGQQSGSDTLVHYLDHLGDRLLRRDSGRSTRRRFEEPTQRFLDHQLGIADVHATLVMAARHGQLELLRCEIEPVAWRDYVGIGGARLTLKPDLYAETAFPPGSEYVDAAFVEIDRGTEHLPTLKKKCREYENYRRQGIEQERSDGAFPLVVWSMTADTEAKAERRRIALREAIAADQTLRTDIFRVIAPEQLIATLQKGAET